MAEKSTTKTAYYFRAKQFNKPLDLQALIEKARKEKSTVADSEIAFSGGDIVRIQHYRKNKTGVFVHLARYVPGDEAPTLMPKAAEEEDNENTQTAPRGQEFKDGDCYFLVSKHDLIFCSHGILNQKMSKYLSLLFQAANIEKKEGQFDLSPATNIDKLKLMKEHGVKSVLLSSNAYDISIPKKNRKTWFTKGFGAVSDQIKALVEKDDSLAEMQAREDLLVNIEVKLKGNTLAAYDAKETIEDIAESVIGEDNDANSELSILTQKGEKIRADEIKLKKPFGIKVKNRSVSYSTVWSVLKSYLEELKQDNLLEQ